MIVIFSFSAKEAGDSSNTSLKVGMCVGKVFVPHFEEWSEQDQLLFAQKIDHPVRKCAHATEYAILGILWLLTLGAFEVKRTGRWWLAWILSVLYACSDEIHQWFVPGRSCQVKDVLIDSGGTIAGILFLSLLVFVFRKWRLIFADRNDRNTTNV